MAKKTMLDLLVEELREILDAEKQAVRAYPRLVKAASSERLKDALEQHLEQTKGQIERLDKVFEHLDVNARGKTCETLRGLIADARDMIDKDLPEELLDVALIASAQKIEHFEIASYGSARAHAEAMGLDPVADLLEETLEEERSTDEKLNDLAINDVNQRAAEREGGEEEAEEVDRAAAGDKPRRGRKRA